jgi:gluconolactonase
VTDVDASPARAGDAAPAAAEPSEPSARRLPGPPELLPGRPDAIVDLRTGDGAALVGATWRYAEAELRVVPSVGVGDDLGPSGPPNRTTMVEPAVAADFDDSAWEVLASEDLERRLSTGMVCFNWYRTTVTLPERVGDLDVTGATVVFEVVVDDYAEVWVNGQLPKALGDQGGPVVAGFNAPNRVVLTTDARPGQRFTIAVFGINGPISANPANYIWVRTATLDLYRPGRVAVGEAIPLARHRRHPAFDAVVPPGATLERVATGFEFTEGPVWVDGGLLFSSPNTNTIYRWSPRGTVSVFMAKSGYQGPDIGRYHQPGSNGLALSPDGRLTICQHGHRRVLRVNPHGDTTVLADRFQGHRLNSPNDLVYRSDGTLYITDPPFGLPGGADDPARELPDSCVFGLDPDGELFLVTDELAGPNGVALSPDEQLLYVGDWDLGHKAVLAYPLGPDGRATGPGRLVCDLTGEPGDDAIDGLAVAPDGTLFVCGPGGLWVVAPDGTVLGRLELPEAPHNLAWGDDDGGCLYITALSSVYRLRLAA